MKPIGAAHRVRGALSDDAADPVSHIRRNIRQQRRSIGTDLVEERVQCGVVASGSGPHQPAGVMVDHHDRITVPAVVGDLVAPQWPRRFVAIFCCFIASLDDAAQVGHVARSRMRRRVPDSARFSQWRAAGCTARSGRRASGYPPEAFDRVALPAHLDWSSPARPLLGLHPAGETMVATASGRTLAPGRTRPRARLSRQIKVPDGEHHRPCRLELHGPHGRSPSRRGRRSCAATVNGGARCRR
jgi:hypothetical protein